MARVTRLLAASVLVAATALPWATYKDLRSGHTTTLTAGRLGIVVVATAVLSVALSLLPWAHDSLRLRRASVLLGSVAVCLCVATALNRISAANNLANHAVPGSGAQTAYAFGAAVAVCAAAALTVGTALAATERTSIAA